ncbi:MAG: tetratricopeptide repeat protein [Thermoplasmatales archaeon]|nr:tetratricopeptide repeat protein [Thermoplasmatales archaeon]
MAEEIVSQRFVGREKELEELKHYFNEALKGKGKTVIITGDTGIGKTTIVNEFRKRFLQKNVLFLTSDCVSRISDPYLPFIQAFSEIEHEKITPKKEEHPIRIEEVFVVGNSGMLMAHISRIEGKMDKDILGGMLSAVQDFVKDSFGDKGEVSRLGRIDYGDKKILIEHAENIFLAAVVSRDTRMIRNDLRSVVNIIEEDYSNILRKWDGDVSKISGIKSIIKTLMTKEYQTEEIMDANVMQMEKIKMFEMVLQTIQKMVEDNPLVLFLDDIHWADEGSLNVLYYISRNIQNLPVMLIGAYTPEEIYTLEGYKIHPLVEMLQRMGSEKLHIAMPLDKLNESNVSQMLLNMFPNIDYPKEFIERLYRETGGNPLFVEEVLYSLRDKGIIHPTNGKWRVKNVDEMDIPKSVKDVILYRFNKLNEAEQKILQYASVLGMEFDFDTLMCMLDTKEEELIEHVDRLLRERMIKEISQKEDIYRFDHGKTQEIIHRELSGRRTKILHRKAGETIEKLHKKNIKMFAGRLAKHFYNALDYEKAVNYAVTAGRNAENAWSAEDAITYYKTALESLNKLEDSLINKNMRMEMTNKIGRLYFLTGKWDNALDCVRECIKLGAETGNERQVEESYRNIGEIYTAKAKYDLAIKNLEKALKISERINDVQGMAYTLYYVGRVYWRKGDLDNAMNSYKKCLEISEKVKDLSLVAKTYMDIGLVNDLKGEYKKSMDLKMKSLSISEGMGNKYEIARAYNNIGWTYGDKGETDNAIQWFEKCIKISKEVGDMRSLAYGLGNAAEHYAKKENIEKAKDYTDEAEIMFKKLGEKRMTAQCHLNYALICTVKGELDKASKHFEKGIRISEEVKSPEDISQLHFEYGKMYKMRNENKKAVEHFSNAIKVYEEMGNKTKIDEVKKEMAEL